MTDTRTSSRATGRVTLHDVAASAGVSPITASRALRGLPTVAADLVTRVQAAVQRLGYVPDPAARALASARSSLVVVLLPTLGDRVYAELLEAINLTLWPAGYQTLIGIMRDDPATQEHLLRSTLMQRPAGLVVAGLEHSDAARALIDSSSAPCVHALEFSQDTEVHSVGLSHFDAGHALTRHLVERGRKRIALVTSRLDRRMLQLADGYRRCLRDADLYDARREVLLEERPSIAAGAQVFEELRLRQRATDGIFFCSDELAQGGLLAALRMNVRIPQQIAVVGFDDSSASAQMIPALSTAHVPTAEIGAAAAQLLLALMRGEQPAARSVDVGFELRVRASS